ncbi:MAG: hypothetical protein JNL28_06235 [Planctomycetes bacterium]|nr:hypothetical protein [Planctomycetota bacterium]
MSPVWGFTLSFALTLVLLATVVVTGRRALRRVHIACVVCTLLSLAFTIREAYALGRVYDVYSAGMIAPIHLTLAKINTIAFLAPIITGIRTLFVPSTRRLHARVAYAVVTLTVVCAITGFVMILLADPR